MTEPVEETNSTEEKQDFIIEQINDIQGVLELVPFETEILSGISEGQMSLKEELEWLYCLMNNYNFCDGTGVKVVTFKKDGELAAYFIASIVVSKIKQLNRLHVYRIWVNDNDEAVKDKITEILNEWCRGFKVKFWTTSISILNENLIQNMENDWGFKKVSVILERKVK